MNFFPLLAVGAGGALGAIGRWGLSLLPFRGEFPLLTLADQPAGGSAHRLHRRVGGPGTACPRAGPSFGKPACAAASPPSPPSPWRA